MLREISEADYTAWAEQYKIKHHKVPGMFCWFVFQPKAGPPQILGCFSRRRTLTYIHVNLTNTQIKLPLQAFARDGKRWLQNARRDFLAEVYNADNKAKRFAEFFGFKTTMYQDGYAIMVRNHGNDGNGA